ncbi:hypothetical protein [Streptomyces sp. NBC_01334]|uniref:hypothetical protein n=1 Tax=Streptomyces sp. NBC_01334 TaxID=2903827 RepID=UPI002E1153AA|nr:hypothetical protein OG736_02310 [Streptomyces sp. NBC_01334]
MPGQRKRKRQQQDASRRATARTASGTGYWTVLLETQDASEWRSHLRRLRCAEEQIDWSMTRVDTLCGRLVQPTTYRLSLFVPGPERALDRDLSGR